MSCYNCNINNNSKIDMEMLIIEDMVNEALLKNGNNLRNNHVAFLGNWRKKRCLLRDKQCK